MTSERPYIDRVEIVSRWDEYLGRNEIVVRPIWTIDGTPLDRQDGTGYALNDTAAHRRLADRLRRAMLAGVVFPDPVVKRDIYGQTYVSAPSRVLGRTLNADLKRLGF